MRPRSKRARCSSKLDAARQQLAAPFASERVDLVASVADTLLGARAVDRLRPGRAFRFLDPPRRAYEARHEFRGARAAACAGATARPCLSSAAAECRDSLPLLVGARLSRRQRQYRAPAAGDQRPYARHCRPLPRAAGGSGRRVAIVRSLPVAGRPWRQDLRPQRRPCRLGRRRQGRLVRPPALAQRRKVDLVRRPVFVFDDQRRRARQAGRARPSGARQETPQRRVRLRPDGLLVPARALCRRRSRNACGSGPAPPRRLRARVDDGRSRGPRRARDRQDDGRVLRGGDRTRFVRQLAKHEPDQRRGERAGASGSFGSAEASSASSSSARSTRSRASSGRATRRSPISAGNAARSKRSRRPGQAPASRAGRRSAPRSTSISSGTATTSRSN